MWNLITLDGYFEGANPWEIDWHRHVVDDEFDALSLKQIRAADTLLFGRVTYEGMAAFWPSQQGEVADLMNGMQKVVFSRTLKGVTWANTRILRGEVRDEVRRLKQQRGKDLLIFGSGGLCSTLMKDRLIDEYRVGVVPIVLGGGTSLFKPEEESTRLKLVESRSLKSGCVYLRYKLHSTAVMSADGPGRQGEAG